jgi:endonuclease/exonuclease/phosphatase family metal-dependent hydrolase
MAKAFSVASWNVEHFRSQGVDSRVTDVVAFVREQEPDVFALYEVEGKRVFDALTTQMPEYTFHITEGAQVQQILLGVRQSLTAFFTQKTEFKTGVSLLRPGALLTLKIGDEAYPLLFLHTKSGVDPRGLGLRDDILRRALDFAHVLDRTAPPGKRANYIFLGDFNLMGMEYTFVRERDILAASELLKLERGARRRQMQVLNKDETFTWWGGGKLEPSNLDFVVARNHMQFRTFNGAEVSVRGWPKLASDEERLEWVRRFSDHALLLFEVQRVDEA